MYRDAQRHPQEVPQVSGVLLRAAAGFAPRGRSVADPWCAGLGELEGSGGAWDAGIGESHTAAWLWGGQLDLELYCRAWRCPACSRRAVGCCTACSRQCLLSQGLTPSPPSRSIRAAGAQQLRKIRA